MKESSLDEVWCIPYFYRRDPRAFRGLVFQGTTIRGGGKWPQGNIPLVSDTLIRARLTALRSSISHIRRGIMDFLTDR